jgi:hypothetical protein
MEASLVSLSSNPAPHRELIGIVDFVLITATIVALLARVVQVYLLFLEGRSAKRDLRDWTDALYRSHLLAAVANRPAARSYLPRQQDYSFP